MEPSRRRTLEALAVACLLALGFLWRLPVAPVEWRLALCDNDSLYQLHRVEECLRQFPSSPSVDAFSHYPRGYRVHWMPLHTAFYAGVARVAGIGAGERPRLVAVLSWIPPLLAVVGLWIAYAIAARYTESRACRLSALLLCVLAGDTARPFFFGTIDHHLFAHLGILLMVWGRLRPSLALWTLGAAAMLAMTPEAIVLASAALGCLFLAEIAALATGGERDLRRPPAWLLTPAAVALAAWGTNRVLETDPLPLADLSWGWPTLFTPLWLLALGGGMAAALAALARRARRHGGRAGVAAAGAALAAVALASAAFLLSIGAAGEIAARLLGGAQRLFVAEEASVFGRGFWSAPAWYRLLALSSLYVAVELATALRRAESSKRTFGWLALAAALALGFAEDRHLYTVAALPLIGLALAAFATEKALRRLPMFAGRARFVPALLVVAAIVPLFAGRNVQGHFEANAACDKLPLMEDVAAWLRRHTPDPAPGGDPAYGVFTPWSEGHHVHVLAGRPVVVDPFNYGRDRWVEEAIVRVFHAATAGEMTEALRAYDTRYLVLTNPAFEILGTLGPDSPDRDELAKRDADGAIRFLPPMSRFASFRLYMSGGTSAEFGHWQPRHLSADADRYTAAAAGVERTVVIPRGQIYELKPGAVITGAAPPGATSVSVRFHFRRAGEPSPETVERALAVDDEGRYRFHTALPAPFEESSFRIEGGYEVVSAGRSRTVEVSQQMVDDGAIVAADF